MKLIPPSDPRVQTAIAPFDDAMLKDEGFKDRKELTDKMYELMKKGVYVERFVENDIDQALIRINTLKDVLKNSPLKKYLFVMDDIIDETRVFDNGLVEAQTAIEAWAKAEDIILSVYGQFLDFEVYECDENGNC